MLPCPFKYRFEKVLVPQSALIVDQQGPYVFLVVDGKAEIRRVKLGGESGANAIVLPMRYAA